MLIGFFKDTVQKITKRFIQYAFLKTLNALSMFKINRVSEKLLDSTEMCYSIKFCKKFIINVQLGYRNFPHDILSKPWEIHPQISRRIS